MSGNQTWPENEQDDIPLANRVIEVIILFGILLVSVLGNGSLWIVVLRSRGLRTVTSMFILGLSMADLLVALVNMPVTVYTIIVGQWTLSRDACVVTGYINMLTLSTSVLSLCNISINRYVMVCHPGRFKEIYTTRNSLMMMIGVVTLAAVVSMPPLFGWSEYVYTHTHSFCFADWANHMSYAFFMIGCCFCLPCTVMGVCNFLIIHSVRKSRLRIKTHVRHTASTSFHSTGSYHNDPNYKNGHRSNSSKSKSFKDKLFNITRRTSSNKSLESNRFDVEAAEAGFEKPRINIVLKSEAVVEQDGTTVVRNSSTHFASNACCKEIINCKPVNRMDFEGSDIHVHISSDQMLKAKSKSFVRNNTKYSEKTEIKPIDKNHLHPTWTANNTASKMERRPPTDLNSRSNNSISINHPSAGAESTTDTPTSVRRQVSARPLRRREEIRLAFSLVVVVVIFVISWLPYCISMLLSIFHAGNVPREFHMFTLIIGYANSGCNPIVYGVMNQRFKVGFKRLFCFWKKSDISFSST